MKKILAIAFLVTISCNILTSKNIFVDIHINFKDTTVTIQEDMKGELLRRILDNEFVKEAIYKISGRNMYPMYLISPKNFSLSLKMQGFEVDTTGILVREDKHSVMEVVSFVVDEIQNECKIKLSYNRKLKILVRATHDINDDHWHISTILIRKSIKT